MLELGIRRTPRASTIEFLAEALKLDTPQREAFVGAARAHSAPSTPLLQTSPDIRLPTTHLIGRDHELAEVGALLRKPAVRLLTLTGSPGSGKTRLALAVTTELADRYRDGVTLVALGPLRDPDLVIPAMRQALGLRGAGNEAPVDTVARHCRKRHLLLVLDNFEHLLEASPQLVELLGRCPGLQVLVTSRAALRVRPEHDLPVPPLELPNADQEQSADLATLAGVASVRLFAERAEAAVPGFGLTAANAGAVASICRRLDGLPLALELAAPWLKLLPVDELLELLNHRLEILVDGPRDLPERQRTMRATLEWSCELLDSGSRALLRRLSVFAGSASLQGAEAVCQGADALPDGVLRHLAVLVNHNLVQRHESPGEEPRVSMLESIREYGSELLRVSGELEATARAHLEHYADLAVRAELEIRGPAQASWILRLQGEYENLRTALAWAVETDHTAAGLRLAGALCLFWEHSGHSREGLSWLERLLTDSGSVDLAIRAQALGAAGFAAWQLGYYDRSIAHQRACLVISRQLGDVSRIADALRGIGQAVGQQGNYREAIPLLEEAVSLLRESDDRSLLARALGNLGVFVAREGDVDRATALYEEALANHRRAGEMLGATMCLINLGSRAMVDGKLELAQARLSEAAAIADRFGAPYQLAAALAHLSDLARRQGDVTGAETHAREGLLLFARLGDRSGVAHCVRSIAWVAWAQSKLVRAVRLYGAANTLCPIATAPDKDEEGNHQRTYLALQKQLDSEALAAASEAGGCLTLDEVIAEASARI
jgi:predicted ATPase